MGHGRHKGYGFHHVPPVPVTDYSVTGELSPDATCNYQPAGTFNGMPYYRRGVDFWFVWWHLDGYWVISATLGEFGAGYWKRTHPSPLGIYEDIGGFSGIATFAEGSH